jgi:hypothetical protein
MNMTRLQSTCLMFLTCENLRDVFGYPIVYARLTARHVIHLNFDIGPNALEIRALQSTKCIV